MTPQDFLRSQRTTRDLWPERFCRALRAGMSDGERDQWLPEFRRRYHHRVPDFAGTGLFATLLAVENMTAPELADYILGHVFMALQRNQPRETAALTDYVRRCIRSVAVTLRRQSLDSVQRAGVRDEEVYLLSLDEQPGATETIADESLTAAADQVSEERVLGLVRRRAAADGQLDNVEIVLRSVLEDISLADIAREWGVSRQAIAKRYQRGLTYLRREQAEVFSLAAV